MPNGLCSAAASFHEVPQLFASPLKSDIVFSAADAAFNTAAVAATKHSGWRRDRTVDSTAKILVLSTSFYLDTLSDPLHNLTFRINFNGIGGAYGQKTHKSNARPISRANLA